LEPVKSEYSIFNLEKGAIKWDEVTYVP
jgi:hypothetical protein